MELLSYLDIFLYGFIRIQLYSNADLFQQPPLTKPAEWFLRQAWCLEGEPHRILFSYCRFISPLPSRQRNRLCYDTLLYYDLADRVNTSAGLFCLLPCQQPRFCFVPWPPKHTVVQSLFAQPRIAGCPQRKPPSRIVFPTINRTNFHWYFLQRYAKF